MRKIIISFEERIRPILKTPAKGSEGDLCVQSDEVKTDINNILARYAGNLSEMTAWRNSQVFGDATLLGKDLLEIHQLLADKTADAASKFASDELLTKRFKTFDEYVQAVKDGWDGSDLVSSEIDDKLKVGTPIDNNEVNDEKKENQ